MAIIIAECNPKILTIDEKKYPDKEMNYIYEHLKYYCSKFDPLPAVTIKLDDGGPLVVQGHKYVRIALELGRVSMRTIFTDDLYKDAVQKFLDRESVRILDLQSIRREEEEMSIVDAEHIFFFHKALSGDQKREFEEIIMGFFNRLQSVLLCNRSKTVSRVSYSHNDSCAEFAATTPVSDQSWFAEFHLCCLNYSRNVARIASYQGRKFVTY